MAQNKPEKIQQKHKSCSETDSSWPEGPESGSFNFLFLKSLTFPYGFR